MACRAAFLFLLGAAATGISIFAAGYFRRGEGTPPGLMCLQYHLFLASMGFVLLADDAYGFMLAWETMALSSYFLVTTQHRIPEIRSAGFLYLLIAHVGAIAILLSFGVLQGGSWQFTFDAMRGAQLEPVWAAIAFLLALFGFGAKAGLVPMHVWLPEAHPGGALAGLRSDERRDAQDGAVRPAARHVRPARRAAVVVGADPARTRSVHGVVWRDLRGRADRYEASAGVLLDREHRHHFHGRGTRDSVRRHGDARCRVARHDRRAVPRAQSCVHEESAVSRHRRGAACHRRAQPGTSRRA